MWFKKKTTEETNKLFTEDWAQKWKEGINSSDKYAKQGKNWNAPILILFDPVPDELNEEGHIGFYIDLKYGNCEELRHATKEDKNRVDVILSASKENWIHLLSSKKDPTMLIMKGKIKLEKGSLVMLSIHRKAATTLLSCAPISGFQEPKSDSSVNNSNNGSFNKKRDHFKTTNKGLNFESFPMQLFQKSKKLGVWNPSDIDFSKDHKQWVNLEKEEQDLIIHLSGLFMAGEEAVTSDLLPLISVVAKEGRIEEEIYLTSFLWEEAKHTEFFSLFVKEVIQAQPDFEKYHGPFYKELFYKKLPQALNNLYQDASPLAQLKASATYNIIVEGTLAETGYEAFSQMLNERDLLPGLRQGITLLKQDESRHIAFALYFIDRIMQENKGLQQPFEDEVEILLDDATNMIFEIFDRYEKVPFGLEREWFLNYALKQFQKRMHKLGLN